MTIHSTMFSFNFNRSVRSRRCTRSREGALNTVSRPSMIKLSEWLRSWELSRASPAQQRGNNTTATSWGGACHSITTGGHYELTLTHLLKLNLRAENSPSPDCHYWGPQAGLEFWGGGNHVLFWDCFAGDGMGGMVSLGLDLLAHGACGPGWRCLTLFWAQGSTYENTGKYQMLWRCDSAGLTSPAFAMLGDELRKTS